MVDAMICGQQYCPPLITTRRDKMDGNTTGPGPAAAQCNERNASDQASWRRGVDAGQMTGAYGVEAGQTTKTRDPGLRPLSFFNFGVALTTLRRGEKVARSGWNGCGQYLELQYPEEQSTMTRPYISIRTVDERVPWVASQTDLLASDWCLVEELTALKYHDSPGAVVDGQFHYPGRG
jgi:hypothetical protein